MIKLYKRNKRKFLNYITSFLLLLPFISFLITYKHKQHKQEICQMAVRNKNKCWWYTLPSHVYLKPSHSPKDQGHDYDSK
jgi:hypothetical protein